MRRYVVHCTPRCIDVIGAACHFMALSKSIWPYVVFTPPYGAIKKSKSEPDLLPSFKLPIMRFFGCPRGAIVTISTPIPDLQAEASVDEAETLTDTEAEFLDLYESMSEEDQAVLTRIAQLLEASPQDEPTSKDKFEELFVSAKRLQ